MIRAVSESFPLPPASDQRHSSMLQPPSPQAVTSPETPLSPLDMPEASPPEELTPGEQEPADIQITPSVTTAPEDAALPPKEQRPTVPEATSDSPTDPFPDHLVTDESGAPGSVNRLSSYYGLFTYGPPCVLKVL